MEGKGLLSGSLYGGMIGFSREGSGFFIAGLTGKSGSRRLPGLPVCLYGVRERHGIHYILCDKKRKNI